jgi:hypothetical protein
MAAVYLVEDQVTVVVNFIEALKAQVGLSGS